MLYDFFAEYLAAFCLALTRPFLVPTSRSERTFKTIVVRLDESFLHRQFTLLVTNLLITTPQINISNI